MSFDSVPDLSARQLRAIVALVENRSFIAAAAFLRVSQPALTRTVKQVENVLGVELFQRSTRRVTVTQAGRDFVALAERLLSDLKIGVGSLRARLGEQRGQIVVSSVLLLSEPRLPQFIANFRRQWPGFDIHFREGTQANVLDDVRTGMADFGIAYVNSLPNLFAAETLGVEALHVVLPSNHALARRRKIDIVDLKEASLISYPTDARTRQLTDSMAASAGFAPRHTITVNRASTLFSLVRSGVGAAIVPSSERPVKGDRQITSRPITATKISRLGIVRLQEHELNPATVALLAGMKEWIRVVAPRRLRAARRS